MTRRVEIRGRFWRVPRGMAYKRASAPQILWSASSFGIYRRVSVQYRSAWVPPELRGCTATFSTTLESASTVCFFRADNGGTFRRRSDVLRLNRTKPDSFADEKPIYGLPSPEALVV